MKKVRELEFKDAITEGLFQAMKENPRVLVIGEGVDDMTGIFGTTLKVAKHFPKRVMDMPLSEELITGVGTGAALTGMRPVMVHARNDFVYLTLNQVANHAAVWSEMHGGGIKIPWVIRALVGRGWGNAAQHSQSLQAIFAHIPCLKVVMPSTPYHAKGLLISAIEDDSPVVFIEHRNLYHFKGMVPEGYYTLPLDKGNVIKSGSDLTIVAVSLMVPEAQKAALVLEKNGINVEVIDVSSISPLDKKLICKSVKKTGRALILDTAWKSFGVSAEISAIINEELLKDLKSPVRRIALPDFPTPCSYVLEDVYFPNTGDIVNVVLQMLGRKKMKKKKIEKELLLQEELKFQGPF